MQKKGFTLVELLVVIAIIALLMSILLPAMNKAKEQAKKVWCLANIRGVMLSTRTYTLGNDGYLPFSKRMEDSSTDGFYMICLDYPLLLTSEGLNPRKMHCPADIQKPGTVAWRYEAWRGTALTNNDHIGGEPPIGVEPKVNYSYIYCDKMIRNVVPNEIYGHIIDSSPGSGWKQWRLSDIKHPSRLITYSCAAIRDPDDEHILFWYGSGAHFPKGKKGYLGGFLDGHSASHYSNELDFARQMAVYPPSSDTHDIDMYSIHKTISGIKGWDVK